MLLSCFQDNPHCPVTAAKASIKSASCFCYTPQGDNHFTDFRSHILEDIRLQVTKMGSKLQANLLVYGTASHFTCANR